jgi:hypothetical protein
MSNGRDAAAYVETADGEICVPRPTSVFAGWGRFIYIYRRLGKRSVIVSPEIWDRLVREYKVKNLDR